MENRWQVGLTLTLLPLGFAYLVIFFLGTNYLANIPYPSACLYGNNGPPTQDWLMFAFIAIPLLATIPLTVWYDALTYFYLKRRSKQINIKQSQQSHPTMSRNGPAINVWVTNVIQNQKSNQKLKSIVTLIPLKATIVPAFTVVPMLMMHGIKKRLDFTLVMDIYSIFPLLLIVSAIRLPLVVAVTVKKNKENQAIDKDREREERLKLELVHAQRERQFRQLKRSATVIGTETATTTTC